MHGNKGKKFTQEHKDKIGKANSISLLGKTGYWLGKKRDTETVEKLRKSRLGSTHTEEWKLNASKRMKNNKFAYKNGLTGNVTRRKEIGRKHQLKRYGLTLEEYDVILAKQSHKCKICEIDETKLRIKLAVDHDHKTGKVRGLLCDKCNRGIGLLNEDIGTMSKAIIYLTS